MCCFSIDDYLRYVGGGMNRETSFSRAGGMSGGHGGSGGVLTVSAADVAKMQTRISDLEKDIALLKRSLAPQHK